MANILILGCGKLGLPVAQQMLKNDHTVTALRRSKPINNELAKDLTWIYADISKPQAIAQLPQHQVDLIIIILTPDAMNEAAYRSTFINGVGNILSWHRANNLKSNWLFVSSTSVYGQNNGEEIDEASPALPSNYRGQVLLEAENLIASYCHSNNMQHIVVRFSGIYGAERNRLIMQVEKLAEQNEIINVPSIAITNRIHQKDCIGILCHLSELLLSGKPHQSLYLASDNHPVASHTVKSWIAQQQGLSLTFHQPNSAKETGKRVSNKRLLQSGYQFIYPSYQDGYLRD